MKKEKFNLNQKFTTGLSLMELVVAIGIFTAVVTIGIGAMLAMYGANQKSLALRSVMNNLNFSIESISREIVVGTNYVCDEDIGDPFVMRAPRDCSGEGEITFCSSEDKPIAFRFRSVDDRGRIERRIGKLSDPEEKCKSGVEILWWPNSETQDWQSITALEVDIFAGESKFYIEGTDQQDTIQPRVRMLIEGEAGTRPGQKSDFVIQTTLSQRTPDIASGE